jgi:hypothetical protein
LVDSFGQPRAGVIGFKPIWQPNDHVSFFTAAEGWGLFTQKRTREAQTEQIEVKFGTLKVKELLCELPEGAKPAEVTALVNNQKVDLGFDLDDAGLRVAFGKPIVLEVGSLLKVNIGTGRKATSGL